MGKLKPAIAHRPCQHLCVPSGGKVLDPFTSIGTIPFEASLQGKYAFGFDISPTALAIANAKAYTQDATRCDEAIQALNQFILSHNPTGAELCEAAELGFNGKIADYYEGRTLDEILLRHAATSNKTFLAHLKSYFLLASLLHILHGNRPYALSRRSHPITPYQPTGEFVYKPLISKLSEKVHHAVAEPLPPEFVAGQDAHQDATSWCSQREIDDLDAVITSPPFFDSTRFYLANWLRLWFAGWSKTKIEKKPRGFVDERQKQGFSIYDAVLRQAHRTHET